MTLVNISDRAFHDQEVEVNGRRFLHCSFLNCRLIVRRGMFEFHDCIKTGGTVVHVGEALKIVRLHMQGDSVFSIGADSDLPAASESASAKSGMDDPVMPRGRWLRFYLLLFLMMFAALAFLLITMSSPDPLIHYGGPIIAGHIVVALIIFALYQYFFLQNPFPDPEQETWN